MRRLRRLSRFASGRGDKIGLAGCWAHVRRKFYEDKEQTPRTAGWILRQIQHLYRVEADLREQKAGPQLRAAVRAWQSRPLVARLKRVMIQLKTSGHHLPQSPLAGAIEYALNQWSTLEVFLNDGRVEIDNNLVENAIRPTALGKKNWLFIGQAEAGERSAIIYTVIESCRRRGLNPYAYLRACSHPPAPHDQQTNPGSHPPSLGQSPTVVASATRIINVVAPMLRHLRSHCRCSVKRCSA